MRPMDTIKQSTSAFVWVLTLAGVICAVTARAAPQYSVTPLGFLAGGAMSHAYGISDTGQVVGESAVSIPGYTGGHAFVWNPASGISDLSASYTAGSLARDINEAGQAVGYQGSGGGRPVLWQPGTAASELPLLPGGTNGGAFAINMSGQIAGGGDTPISAAHAAVWDSALSVTDLAPNDTEWLRALAINDSGWVVGQREQPPSGINQEAFLWTPDTGMRTLWSSSGGASATGINSLGQVVGYNYYSNGYIWDPVSGLRRIGGDPNNYWNAVSPDAINDSAQVVGWAQFSPRDSEQAFIWSEANGMQYLNGLIPTGTGWFLKEATDINNKGQIVGWGYNPSGQTEAFLLTPVPEPSSLAALALALTGLGGAFVRKRRG